MSLTQKTIRILPRAHSSYEGITDEAGIPDDVNLEALEK